MDTWYDSSGLILYYTPKLREYNAATLTLGQMSLNIPPGQPSVVEQGTCSSRCTNKIFKGPIQVFESQHHMHYLGEGRVCVNNNKNLLFMSPNLVRAESD